MVSYVKTTDRISFDFLKYTFIITVYFAISFLKFHFIFSFSSGAVFIILISLYFNSLHFRTSKIYKHLMFVNINDLALILELKNRKSIQIKWINSHWVTDIYCKSCW